MKNLLIFCFLIILLLAVRFLYFFKNPAQYQAGQKVEFSLTLLSDPKTTTFNQTFYAQGVKIITARFPELHYADKIKLKGTIKKETIFSKGRNGLIKESEVLVIKNPLVEINSNGKNIFLAIASSFRQKIAGLFSQVLDKEDSDLLMGIVFGVKANFDKDFYDSLRRVGVMHVIAASGMNVSLLGGFFEAFFLLFLRRKTAIIFSACAVIFYTLVSGFSAPILRATFMLLAFYLGSLFGRKSYSYLSLFLAGAALLFINPAFALDIGFRLSFLSTLGIILIKPVLASFLPAGGSTILKVLSEDLLTTLAAQLATLPLLFLSFSAYSPVSIFANALLLWVVPFLMILGGAASIFSLFFVFMAKFVLLIAIPFLRFFRIGVLAFSSISWQMNIDFLPLILIFGYYFILLSFVLFLNKFKLAR